MSRSAVDDHHDTPRNHLGGLGRGQFRSDELGELDEPCIVASGINDAFCGHPCTLSPRVLNAHFDTVRGAADGFGDPLLEGVFCLGIELDQPIPVVRVHHGPIFVETKDLVDDDAANVEVFNCHSAVGFMLSRAIAIVIAPQ